MSDITRALVVYESMYGNTARIASAICAGLRQSIPTEMVPAYRAPTVIPGDVRLLVVGGPTHAFSMSRASTRQEARNQHTVVMPTETGIREWLDMLTADTPSTPGRRRAQVDVATFDTRIAKVRRLPARPRDRLPRCCAGWASEYSSGLRASSWTSRPDRSARSRSNARAAGARSSAVCTPARRPRHEPVSPSAV